MIGNRSISNYKSLTPPYRVLATLTVIVTIAIGTTLQTSVLAAPITHPVEPKVERSIERERERDLKKLSEISRDNMDSLPVRGSEKERKAFSRILTKNVPGDTLKVATLLDRIYYSRDLYDINKAWESKASRDTDELPDTLVGIDAYFKNSQGQTIIIIGHVDKSDFVMLDSEGKEKFRIPIATLNSKAEANNSLLIPIGCKTADAGVPFGFRNNVNTAAVSQFLEEIGLSPTFKVLFSAMQKIGPMKIDLSTGVPMIQASLGNHSKQGDLEITIEIPKKIYGELSKKTFIDGNDLESTGKSLTAFFGGFTFLVWISEKLCKRLAKSSYILGNRSRAHWLQILITLSKFFGVIRACGTFITIATIIIFMIMTGQAGILLAIILVISFFLNVSKWAASSPDSK